MNDVRDAADEALFARLRQMWRDADPMPADLADRMVAAVAVEDVGREYALLTLVEGAQLGAVRSESDTLTLQFSDGSVNVLVHVTADDGGLRRLDGWVDAEPLAIRLTQGEKEREVDAGAAGRFEIPRVPSGLARLRLVVRDTSEASGVREIMTPEFEV